MSVIPCGVTLLYNECLLNETGMVWVQDNGHGLTVEFMILRSRAEWSREEMGEERIKR